MALEPDKGGFEVAGETTGGPDDAGDPEAVGEATGGPEGVEAATLAYVRDAGGDRGIRGAG